MSKYNKLSKEAIEDIQECIETFDYKNINQFVDNIADELRDAPEAYKFSAIDFIFYISQNYTLTKK